MSGHDNHGCDDPECGCPMHRAKRAIGRWKWFVHHVVHPCSSTTVLTAAVVELWELFEPTLHRLMHLVEGLLHIGHVGGH